MHLTDHVDFLNKAYEKNIFLLSGRKNPRVGGVIWAQANYEEEILQFLKEDPFYKNDFANYKVTEIIPTKYNSHIGNIIASMALDNNSRQK
jgi:uncharacterized protein YciI